LYQWTNPQTRQAADGGHGGAQYELAIRYFQGTGVPQDIALANELLHRSADQGIPEAKEQLAKIEAW
jgi:TPR repeat protein